MAAAMLLFSREVTADKIAVVSDKPINIADEIEKLPVDGQLRRLIALRADIANHPISTLAQMRVIVAPEKAADFPQMLGVAARQPSAIVAAPADTRAQEVDVLPPEPQPEEAAKLKPEGEMGDKFSDPLKPFMKIVHINTLTAAGFFRNFNLKHDFGEKNIVTVESPGDKIELGLHDVVLVDYPKRALTGPDRTRDLEKPEEVQLAFVVRFLQMGLDPKRVAVIELNNSLITSARNDFDVFKRLFSKTTLTAGAVETDIEGLVPVYNIPDPELVRLHGLLKQTHAVGGSEVFNIADQLAAAFGDQLNFRPTAQRLVQGAVEVESSNPTQGPGEGGCGVFEGVDPESKRPGGEGL